MAQTKKVENLSSNNLIIVLLLISLLVVGISGLVAKTLVTTIIRNTKVVDAKSKADKQLKTDVDAAPKLVDSYAALGAQSLVLADALPNTVDLPSLLVAVENMGVEAGIKVKTIAPVQQVTDDGGTTASSSSSNPTPQVYPFSITFDGTYPTLQKFLNDIEISARPMRVIGVQLNGSGSALSGEIDIQTYYQDKAQLPFSTETIK